MVAWGNTITMISTGSYWSYNGKGSIIISQHSHTEQCWIIKKKRERPMIHSELAGDQKEREIEKQDQCHSIFF